uniref:Uncharacterized protein n=1 Tax=Medicago truncatula TaxID=3880 RepID=A2Q1M6_MEDTR|nr:hypothetical protein MtrDRAFT_AC148970g28v2 [Medicago truncatula]
MMDGDANNNHARNEKAQLEDHPHSKPPNTTKANDSRYGPKIKAAYNINTKSSPPPTKTPLRYKTTKTPKN